MTTTTITRNPGIRYRAGQVNRINRVRQVRRARRMRSMLAALLVMTFTAAATVSFTEMVMLRSASAATQEEAIKAGVKLGVKDGIYLGSLKHQSGVNAVDVAVDPANGGKKLGVESVATPVLWDAWFKNVAGSGGTNTNGLTLWSHYLIDSVKPSNYLYSSGSQRTRLTGMLTDGTFMTEEKNLLYNDFGSVYSTCIGVVASNTYPCSSNTAGADRIYLPAVKTSNQSSYSMTAVYLGTLSSGDNREIAHNAYNQQFKTTYKNGSAGTCDYVNDWCLSENGSNHWWFRNPGRFIYSNTYGGPYQHVMMFQATDNGGAAGQINPMRSDAATPKGEWMWKHTTFGLRPVTSMTTSGIIWASEINGSMGSTPSDVGATNWSYEPNAIGGRNYRLTLVGPSDASLNTPTCPNGNCSVNAGTGASVGSGTTVEPGNQLAYKIVKNIGQADEQIVAYREGAPGQSTLTGDIPTGSNTLVMWEQQYKSSGTRLASIPVMMNVRPTTPLPPGL